MKHSIWILIGLLLCGCGGGSGGSDNNDEVTLCTTYREMDLALSNAVEIVNTERSDQHITVLIPRESFWVDFQSLAIHEVFHIALQGSGDEHVDDPGAVMYKDTCWNCFKHRLTQDDHALITREKNRDEKRTVVYLGVQHDTSLCNYVAEWVNDDGKIARVRGQKIQFQEHAVTWAFPITSLLAPGAQSPTRR